MKKVITFGTFDLFHYGHLRILERAASYGDKLIVGVSSDKLNFSKKGFYPVYTQEHRSDIVAAIRYVDSVFIEESLDKKIDYIKDHKADILVMGAKPLTLLDYIASDKIDPYNIATLVNGLAKACQNNSVALVGGETAEMPDTYLAGEHDFVGIVTGVVDKNNIIDGKNIKPGNILLGLPSSGLHTNGFSLARHLLFKLNNYNVNDKPDELAGSDIKSSLLAPHVNYQKPVMELLDNNIKVNGMVHITGGGLIENTPRVLPKNCGVEIDLNSWPKLPIFDLLVKLGGLKNSEAYKTFNMGIGYVFILPEDQLDAANNLLDKIGVKAYEIGKVVEFDSCDESSYQSHIVSLKI